MLNIALILAGGTGRRLGADIPKQYIEVHGRTIISYCLNLFAAHDRIDGIQIAADKMWREFIQSEADKEIEKEKFKKKFRGFSDPGETRQMTIVQGLSDILSYAGEDTAVVVHDAVRPCVTEALISSCLDTLGEHDGVVPVLPMKDTVYYSNDRERISSLLDRSHIFAGQAPEAFRLKKYYEANVKLLPKKILEINGSTEPAVLAGLDIVMIPGDEANFKITTREDLTRFKEKVYRS